MKGHAWFCQGRRLGVGIVFAFVFLIAVAGLGVKWTVSSDAPMEPLIMNGLDEGVPSPLNVPDSIPYDRVSWLCSHNAMSNSMDGWVCPNQNWDIPSQLRAGIHAQMWDVWEHDGELVLRHGNRTVSYPGSIPLKEALGFIKSYLSLNPRAVVTVIFESYVSNGAIRKVADEAGMTDFCAVLPEKGTWPTLGEMRSSGKRLILLTDRPDGVGWPMPVWKHAVETPWKNVSEVSMSDDQGRGSVDNRLFMVNHIVSTWRPARSVAERVNSMDILRARSERIWRKWGRNPNFWVLDFVDIGDGRKFVHEVNVGNFSKSPSRFQENP